MFTRTLLIMLCVALPSLLTAQTGIYTIDSADGGDARMDIGFFKEINADAGIRRVSWTLNNSECPVELIKEAGLKPEFDSDKNLYTYIGKGEARARKHVQAFEVTYFIFDVFHRFVGASYGVEIIDFEPEETFDLKRMGKFLTDWAEMHYFYQTVAFVSMVRLDSGDIWEANYEDVEKQITKLSLELPTEDERTRHFR